MRLWTAVSVTVIASAANAAGGHFDVDDATVLDPGHCQIEAWALRAPAASTTIAHVGPGCRVGPVEIGVNLDRIAGANETRTLIGPQLKWVADPWVDKLSAGVAWSAAYDTTNGGRVIHTVYAPITWWAAEKLWVHGNFGVDIDAQGQRWGRRGASVEWAASDQIGLICERVKIVGNWTSRLGSRYNLSDSFSIDLSAARYGPRAERVFVIGFNRDFAR